MVCGKAARQTVSLMKLPPAVVEFSPPAVHWSDFQNPGLVISIFGLPFGPQGLLGVVFWPFIGAFVGEYLNKHDLQPALKAAWGAFIGFLSGTLMKVVYCIALLVVVVIKLF